MPNEETGPDNGVVEPILISSAVMPIEPSAFSRISVNGDNHPHACACEDDVPIDILGDR